MLMNELMKQTRGNMYVGRDMERAFNSLDRDLMYEVHQQHSAGRAHLVDLDNYRVFFNFFYF